MTERKFSDVFTLPVQVQPEDIDEMNHVNNLQYLKWCMRAAVKHSAHVGWDSKRYRELGQGFIVREHQIKYRIPALLNDDIEVKTWIENLEKVSSDRRYHVIRKSDGRRLAEGRTTWVFVDFGTLALSRIPNEIREAFAPMSD